MSSSIFNDEMYNYDYFCQENVCRLCWKITNNTKSLFNNSVVTDMILKYIDINVTIQTPPNPQKVCNSCFGVIENFDNFKKTCQEADRKLKTILATGSSQKEIKPEDKIIKEVTLKIESDYEPDLPASNHQNKEKCDTIFKQEVSDVGSDHFELFDDDDLFDKGANYHDTFKQNHDSIVNKPKNNLENCTYYECLSCKEKFKELASKVRHELECDTLNKFECFICQKVLESDTLFQDHMKSHRNNINKTVEAKTTDIHSVDTKIKNIRPLCTKPNSYTSLMNLKMNSNRNSVRTTIRPNISSINTKIKPHISTINTKVRPNITMNTKMKSNKRFVNTKIKSKARSRNTKIKSHTKSEDTEKKPDIKGVRCNKCTEIFETRSGMEKHRKEQHYKQPCICEICGLSVNYSSMTAHMLKHTSPKEYQCPHCSYYTTYQSSFTVHLRIHTGERRFACDKCPYRSYKSSNLYAHQRRHLGIKPQSVMKTCHMCGKSYTTKRLLEEHIASTHDNIRRNVCRLCPAAYFRFKNLKQHILIKHGKRARESKGEYTILDAEP